MSASLAAVRVDRRTRTRDHVEFEETYAAPSKRYSIGVESTSGSHCVSIPASSGKPDDFEYYEITRDQYREFLFDHRKALRFAEACQNRELDALLMKKPDDKS